MQRLEIGSSIASHRPVGKLPFLTVAWHRRRIHKTIYTGVSENTALSHYNVSIFSVGEGKGGGSPIVKGEVEDVEQGLTQVLGGVSGVGLLPAGGGELIDQQSSHAILQGICTPHSLRLSEVHWNLMR